MSKHRKKDVKNDKRKSSSKLYIIGVFAIIVVSIGILVFLMSYSPVDREDAYGPYTANVWKNGTLVSYWEPQDVVTNWGIEITHTDGFWQGKTQTWSFENKNLQVLRTLEIGRWYSFGVAVKNTGHADETITILVYIQDEEGNDVWNYYN